MHSAVYPRYTIAERLVLGIIALVTCPFNLFIKLLSRYWTKHDVETDMMYREN